MFVGNQHTQIKVNDISRYFFDKKLLRASDFKINLVGSSKPVGLGDLDEKLLRDFQEYVIPTIEITLNEDDPTALDEMISLFVDINSYGEPVKRFDIVKAMSKDRLLKSVFDLIALKQTRGKDVFYRSKRNEFTRVLQTLQVVNGISVANAQVDRMWELTVELVLFIRNKKHRNPVEILKSFIRVADQSQKRITTAEVSQLRSVFTFLLSAYKNPHLTTSRLATNQIHFYTMVTAIIASDMLTRIPEKDLVGKLIQFGLIIDGKLPIPKSLSKVIGSYLELSRRQTTHVSRREERQEKFITAINSLPAALSLNLPVPSARAV